MTGRVRGGAGLHEPHPAALQHTCGCRARGQPLGVLTWRGMTCCSPEPGTPAVLRILRRGCRLPGVTSGMPPLWALPQAVEVAPGPQHHALGSARYWTGALVSLLFQTCPATAFADTAPGASARGRAGCGASLTSPRGGLGSLCRAEGRPGCRARERLQRVPRAPGLPVSAGLCPAESGFGARRARCEGAKSKRRRRGPSVLHISCPSGCVMVVAVPGASHAGRRPRELHSRREPAVAAAPRGCAGRGAGVALPSGTAVLTRCLCLRHRQSRRIQRGRSGKVRGPRRSCGWRGAEGCARAGRHIRGAEKPRGERARPRAPRRPARLLPGRLDAGA